jgi:hypothetical protein
MNYPTSLFIPLADQVELAAVDAKRATRLERQRRYRDANREKIRASGRAHYHANRTRILAQQLDYRRTEAGRAVTKRANDKRRPKDPLQKLAVKFTTHQKKTSTDMNKPISRASGAKSPPKSSPRGRPAWLVAFAKENHVTLAELRQVSRLIARQRQVQKKMADLEARITSRAAAASKKA